MCTAEKSDRPEQNQDLRCQSGPSAKDSVIFSGGDSSKNYGADQQRLQISDLHFDKFPHQQLSLAGRYYSRRNKFERFRGFLELISRFEFEFCRRENYFF